MQRLATTLLIIVILIGLSYGSFKYVVHKDRVAEREKGRATREAVIDAAAFSQGQYRKSVAAMAPSTQPIDIEFRRPAYIKAIDILERAKSSGNLNTTPILAIVSVQPNQSIVGMLDWVGYAHLISQIEFYDDEGHDYKFTLPAWPKGVQLSWNSIAERTMSFQMQLGGATRTEITPDEDIVFEVRELPHWSKTSIRLFDDTEKWTDSIRLSILQ